MNPSTVSGIYLQARRSRILILSAVALAAVAWLDWVESSLAIGFLYIVPIVMASPVLARWQIVVVALLGTTLRELFGEFPASSVLVARASSAFLAFAGVGLFVREVLRNQAQAVRRETRLREEAEEQYWLLIESSLAAIVTADPAGRVTAANRAAHELFGFRDSMTGADIRRLLPAGDLIAQSAAPGRISRRMLECTAHRRDGSAFYAQVWTSTFQTAAGPRLNALIFDVSKELRVREQDALRHQFAGARVAMGAVWHEVRNLCGAISMIAASLQRSGQAMEREQLRALETLVEGLRQLVAGDLPDAAGDQPLATDLPSIVEELRVIIEPTLKELGARQRWNVPYNLPAVRGGRHPLLQVFLNLSLNAQRALQRAPGDGREFSVEAAVEQERVRIRFTNSGPGIPDPAQLFQPFQKGADATGLGLYISRAMLRSFGGDLRYTPSAGNPSFTIELEAVAGSGARHLETEPCKRGAAVQSAS